MLSKQIHGVKDTVTSISPSNRPHRRLYDCLPSLKSQKATIYIRVSTEDQAREGYSLEAQKRQLENFVKENGYEMVGIYEDAGFSGKDTDRPALQQLLLDAKEGIFDVLVTLSPDRLSRNIIDQAAIREILEKFDIPLKFLTLPVDTTTPEGDLITNIISSVGQYERKIIGRRVKIGMRQKAQKGGFNGMSAPYGYDIIDGELRINSKEAEVVKCIFKMHGIGMSLESITNLLNEFDVSTKKGGAWSKKQVWRILHSAIVRGNLRWDGITAKGAHPAIIGEGMNDTTNDLLTAGKLPFNQKKKNWKSETQLMKKDDIGEKSRSLRIKEGIAKAKLKREKWGRPSIIDTKGDPKIALKAAEMRSQGLSWSEIASNLKIGKTTARRLVSLCQKDEDIQKTAQFLNQQNGG